MPRGNDTASNQEGVIYTDSHYDRKVCIKVCLCSKSDKVCLILSTMAYLVIMIVALAEKATLLGHLEWIG